MNKKILIVLALVVAAAILSVAQYNSTFLINLKNNTSMVMIIIVEVSVVFHIANKNAH